MRSIGAALSVGAAFGLAVPWAAAQCGHTATSVTPNLVGQAMNRAVATFTVRGTANVPRTMTDGVAFRINSGGLFGEPTVTYEFDMPGGTPGVIPGHIAVVPDSDDILVAAAKLVEVVNSDPNSPVWARYVHSPPGSDYGIANGWLTFVWKYDGEYGIANQEVADPNNDIQIGNFSSSSPNEHRTFFRVLGSGLNDSALGVQVRSVVNPAKTYPGTVTVRDADGLTFKATLNSAADPAPLGAYDVIITKAGCPDQVLPGAFTLVENLLDDPTFRANANGNSIELQWNSWDALTGPWWRSDLPWNPTPDLVRKGSVFLRLPDNRTPHYAQATPRIYPFRTGAHETNGTGDNEHNTLQWQGNDGLHRMWQTVPVNLQQNTTLTLTGLWAGATVDSTPMTYGVQLRSGNEDGAVIAETPPALLAIPFNWREFTVSGRFPAGTTAVTVVFYGDHVGEGRKALHIDEVLLRVNNDCAAPSSISVAGVSPFGIVRGATSSITVTGTGFQGTPTVLLRGAGVTVVATNVVVLNSTTLTCDVDIPAGPSTSSFDVEVHVGACSASLPAGLVAAPDMLHNPLFEEPTASFSCGTLRQHKVSEWQFADQLVRDHPVHLPECEPGIEGVGGHYGSMTTGVGIDQRAWQIVKVTPGRQYTFSGWFAGGGSALSNMKLVDGILPDGPVLAQAALTPGFEWQQYTITATASSPLMLIMWEMLNPSGDTAIHADGFVFEGSPCSIPFADTDGDGDVDQEDFGVFQLCYTGANQGTVEGPPSYCSCLDVEGQSGTPDGDIDQADLAVFLQCISGPTIPADPNCAD